MQLFADESVASQIVRQLRDLGHDVLYPPETDESAADEIWLDKARNEKRILITDDKDFSELVFARKCRRQESYFYDCIAFRYLIGCDGSNRDGRKYYRARKGTSSS